MEFSHIVDVVEQCRISPPSGSVSPVSLPLTFLDIIWLFEHSVHQLFFYEFCHSKTEFLSTVLPNLKHSLSLTLQHFFPLAGNLTWPENSSKPVILCTEGDSVSFTVAESQYDFYQLSGNHPRDVNLFYQLIPELFNTSTTDVKAFPVLALKVTLFPNKGICIGVHYIHAVADGKILVHFIKSWASICRSNHDTSFIGKLLPPSYDRSSIKDSYAADMIIQVILNVSNSTKESFNITNKHVFPIQDKFLATFVMRPRDIKKIKQWVLSRLQNDRHENEAPLYLSTFVLTCAYVWVCLVKAKSGETVDDPMFEYFGFPIDCRARRKPPLPAFYFGNCLGSTDVEAKRSDLIGENGIAIAAKLIGNAIQKGDHGDVEEILVKMEICMDKGLLSGAPGGVLAVGGSTKFGIYDTNFGWGSPKKIEMPSIASTGAMSLSECPDDEVGAVEIGMAQSKKEIDAFTTLFISNLEAFPDCID